MIRGADVVDQYVTAADAAEEKSNAEILSRCDCWHGTICRRGGERMKMMTVYNPLTFGFGVLYSLQHRMCNHDGKPDRQKNK